MSDESAPGEQPTQPTGWGPHPETPVDGSQAYPPPDATQAPQQYPPADQPPYAYPTEGQPPYMYPEGYAYPPAPPEKHKAPTWAWLALAALAVTLVGGLFYASAQQTSVPDVIGMTVDEAEQRLADAELHLGRTEEIASDDVEPGLVAGQDPRPGERVARNSAVSVGVAVATTVDVPDVTEMSESAAALAISDAGLRLGAVDRAFDDQVPAGRVIDQDPGAGQRAGADSTVDITVSDGVQTAEVPDVVGLTEAQARDRIEKAGLDAASRSAESDKAKDTVVAQTPTAGSRALAGQLVTIDVSTGPGQSSAQPPAGESGETKPTPAPPEPEPDPTPEPAPEPEPEPEPDPPTLVAVPDVVGQNIVSVFFELTGADLELVVEWGSSDDGLLTALAQSPDAGTRVAIGSTVTVTFGAPSFLFPSEE